jgi:hypothetical protein
LEWRLKEGGRKKTRVPAETPKHKETETQRRRQDKTETEKMKNRRSRKRKTRETRSRTQTTAFSEKNVFGTCMNCLIQESSSFTGNMNAGTFATRAKNNSGQANRLLKFVDKSELVKESAGVKVSGRAHFCRIILH